MVNYFLSSAIYPDPESKMLAKVMRLKLKQAQFICSSLEDHSSVENPITYSLC